MFVQFEINCKWCFLPLFFLVSSCLSGRGDQKVFNFCSEGAPVSFNPQLAGDGTSFDASSQTLYNRLIELEPGTMNLTPSLAEAWNISNSGKTIEFKLRQDVHFHQNSSFTPTRTLNADDVVFSFSRMLDAKHSYHLIGGGVYEYFKSTGLSENLLSVQKTSQYNVKFELKKPDSSFLANLAMDFASVLSSEYADHLSKMNLQDQIDNRPIGTGPFAFKKYVENKKIKYTAHSKYFQGQPSIEVLNFKIMPNPKKRVSALKDGKCHLIKEPPPGSLPELSVSKKIKLVKIKGLNTAYIGFNLENKKLKNKKLRKAIGLALNRRSYIESVYLGRAEIAHSPIPPAIWNLGSDLPPLDFDLVKAKSLIEESGVDTPLTLTLWTLPVSRPYNPNGRKLGQMMKNDLRQIGVDLELATSSWPDFLERSREGKHELIEYGWSSDNGDPDNFLYTLLTCDGAAGKSNVARFCNLEYDDLVKQAKSVYLKSERKQLYNKALKIFREELPWIPIAHANVYRAMSSEVEGYVPRFLGTESFYRLKLKSWQSKPRSKSYD